MDNSAKVLPFVFAISSGRAGSAYLAHVLSFIQEVHAVHECEPAMNGEWLRLTNRLPMEETLEKRMLKVTSVRAVLAASRCKCYVETNHLYIKTFYDVIEHGLSGQYRVLILQRELSKVIKSFFDLKFDMQRRQVWFSDPQSVNRCIDPVVLPHASEYENFVLQYISDIEARAEAFQVNYPNVEVLAVDPARLTEQPTRQRLLDWLGFADAFIPGDALHRVVNSRRRAKLRNFSFASQGHAKTLLCQYTDKLLEKGISPPRRLLEGCEESLRG